MSEVTKPDDVAEPPNPVQWSDFLQGQPPGSFVDVLGATKKRESLGSGRIYNELIAPELQLYCPQQTCNGLMFFESNDGGESLDGKDRRYTFFTYRCRNCGKSPKTFSFAIRYEDERICKAYKFGEVPPFGPPVPSRVLRLIQPDRELFLCGRRCENQGLGIGALTYYRRVVENQRFRLIDETLRVARGIGAPESTLTTLEAARNERQFSKAVKNLQDAIPPVLLINGHNPLVLLHGALSQGIHNYTDEECLNLATNIRVVLVEFAEKLGNALKDEKELNTAVSQLFQAQGKRKEKKDQ